MRWGIAFRLGLLLAVVGVLASGLTGFYAYQASRDLLVQTTKKELLTTTQVLARRIVFTRQETSRQLQTLADHPATLAVLQQNDPAALAQLSTLFRLLLQANPGYFQIRLISASDHGLERVRVDRDAIGLVDVVGDDLQEKGYYPYVFDALKVPKGQTYLSRIVINHERGAHAGLEKPSVILAMPVVDRAGRTWGVVVVNLDLNATFAQLVADLPKDFTLFLANSTGDFLIHPDSTQAFGFDKGRRVLLQEEFADTAPLVDGRVDQVVVEAREGNDAQTPLVAAFIGSKINVSSSESRLILGVAQPLANVLAQANQLGRTTLHIVAGLCVACILLAMLLARAVTRPINSMNVALKRFAIDQGMVSLPVQRTDEIGELARSFSQMQQQIHQQVDDLQSSRQELEHLARHDMLTGLPNRRFFQDRLDHALEHAQRHGKSLALLFLDLDHFKVINDNIGHDAGDAVLKAVAARLVASTRKSDTVARLGGDEFVVLLEDPAHREHIVSIATKLIEALVPPIPFGIHTLCIGASIGISVYPQDGSSSLEIMANADRAMYKAKAGGRNGFYFFS